MMTTGVLSQSCGSRTAAEKRIPGAHRQERATNRENHGDHDDDDEDDDDEEGDDDEESRTRGDDEDRRGKKRR